jgi:iron complex transport system permease protein
VRIGAIRVLGVGLALCLAAVVTSTVGVIGFVGLVAPLIARLSGARTFGMRLFYAGLFGALLLLLTDMAVQLLVGASYADLLPTGAVTAVLGSPILLWLLPRLALDARPIVVADGPLRSRMKGGRPWAIGFSAFAALVAVALFVGRTPEGAWSLLGRDSWAEILPWRYPRLIASGAAGACLAIAGLVLQRMTANEMASPEILGVSAGATISVAIALFVFPVLSPGTTFMAASLGALGVLAAIVAFGRRSGFAPERVLLAGIAINALLDAMVGVLSATGDPRAIVLLAWMGGSTSGILAVDAGRALVLTILAGFAALLSARWLAILPLGSTAAGSIGLSAGRARLILLVIVAGATAIATPIVGPLTFTGLMAPHIVGMLGVRRPVPAIAASAMAGAMLLIAADWLARVLTFPFQLPTGLLAALVGAPFLLWLLQSRRSPA